MDQTSTKEQIVRHYFDLGFSYLEITCFLLKFHGIKLSVRSLHRMLRTMGLYRHTRISVKIGNVIDAIASEINNSGRDLGYRYV